MIFIRSISCAVLVAGGLTLSAAAGASDYEDYLAAFNKTCDHMVSCARSDMEAEMANIPPEYRGMIEQQLAGACDQINLMQNFKNEAGGNENHPMFKPAQACMESMAALSCDQLMGDNDVDQTPECQKAEKLAEQYGAN
ncbi:MAG: hypothetical protein ABF296_11360 [Oceanococcaceae bacterium]